MASGDWKQSGDEGYGTVFGPGLFIQSDGVTPEMFLILSGPQDIQYQLAAGGSDTLIEDGELEFLHRRIGGSTSTGTMGISFRVKADASDADRYRVLLTTSLLGTSVTPQLQRFNSTVLTTVSGPGAIPYPDGITNGNGWHRFRVRWADTLTPVPAVRIVLEVFDPGTGLFSTLIKVDDPSASRITGAGRVRFGGSDGGSSGRDALIDSFIVRSLS